METDVGFRAKSNRFLSLRSLIFGLLGVFFIAGTARFHDMVLQGTYIVGNQLPAGAFFYFFLIGLGWNGFWNLLDRILRKRHRLADLFALSSKEMAFVIIVTLVSCWTPTSGLFRYFFTQIMMPWYYLPNQHNWEIHSLLTEYLRPELFPTPWPGAENIDTRAYEQVYRGFFTGLATGREAISILEMPLRAWVQPMLIWGPILTLFALVLTSIQFLVHRQWASHEQLAYPIVQVTGQFARMTSGHHTLPDIFRNRLFWWGVIPVFTLLFIEYLSKWYPEAVPSLSSFLPNIKGGWLPMTNHIPILKKSVNYWSIQGWAIYFTFVGIAYFVSSEISLTVGLSCILMTVFSILFYQVNGILLPWSAHECMRGGAYFGYSLILLYTGRTYYRAVLARAFCLRRKRRVPAGDDETETLAEPDDVSVLAARTLLVAFVCFVCLLSWMCQSWLMAIFYSLLLFLLYTVLSRILCESGIPFLAPAWQPTNMLLYLLGPAAIGPHALTFFCWAGNGIFTPDPRESLIGYVANGVKLADDNRLNLKKIFVWICGIAILALIIGWFAAFWSTYNYSPMNDGYAAGSPPRAELNQAARFFSDMKAANTFETSLAANPVERLGMIAGSSLQQHFFLYGFLAVLAVSLLRFRFAGFPIHPILFLIWGSYPSNCAWASFLIGWFIKQLVVRFGGGGVYQKCKPLFVGLIAGEILLIGITIAMDFAYYLATGSQSPVRIWFMPG